MSRSSKKSYLGTVVAVLAAFGIGGAFLERLQEPSDNSYSADALISEAPPIGPREKQHALVNQQPVTPDEFSLAISQKPPLGSLAEEGTPPLELVDPGPETELDAASSGDVTLNARNKLEAELQEAQAAADKLAELAGSDADLSSPEALEAVKKQAKQKSDELKQAAETLARLATESRKSKSVPAEKNGDRSVDTEPPAATEAPKLNEQPDTLSSLAEAVGEKSELQIEDHLASLPRQKNPHKNPSQNLPAQLEKPESSFLDDLRQSASGSFAKVSRMASDFMKGTTAQPEEKKAAGQQERVVAANEEKEVQKPDADGAKTEAGEDDVVASAADPDAREPKAETAEQLTDELAEEDVEIIAESDAEEEVLKQAADTDKAPPAIDSEADVQVVEVGPAPEKDNEEERPSIVLSISKMEYEIGADEKGAVVLAGQSAKDASLRFKMNGDALGKTRADKDGHWQLRAPKELAPGSHWIIAEQIDDKSKVIARAEMPFDHSAAPVTIAAEDNQKALEGEDKLVDKSASAENGGKEEDGGLSQNAKNVWTKITGIFKVQPSNPKQNEAAEKSGEADVAAQRFAFDGVVYSKGQGVEGLKLKGFAKPGNRIRLFSGDDRIGEVVADNMGVWSFMKNGTVRPGPHLFRAGRVVRNGRIDAEVRMQYDHVVVASNNSKPDMAGQQKGLKQLAEAQSSEPKVAVPSVAGADKVQTDLRQKPKKAMKRKRRWRKKRNARRNKVKSRYLVKRQKKRSRYIRQVPRRAHLYPRSRKTPAKVKVRRGTTLWGYSQHYYGVGRKYRIIVNANRRKIKNPNKIKAGQRLRIPKLKRKRARKRR